MIAGVVALDQRGNARAEATAAAAQRLGAQALADDDLDRSLLLARQGVALDDSLADARQPARRAAQEPGGDRRAARRRRPADRASTSAPTAARWRSSTTTARCSFFDTAHAASGGARDGAGVGLGVIGVAVPGGSVPTCCGSAPTASRLAVGGAHPVVLDARTHRVLARLRTLDDARYVYALRFSPDGRTLFAAASAVPGRRSALQRFDVRERAPARHARESIARRDLLVTLMRHARRPARRDEPRARPTEIRDAPTLRLLEAAGPSARSRRP